MTKVKIHVGRGTGTIEVDDDPANWSGDEFKKIQAARKEKAASEYVTTGRGTGKIKFEDIPDPKNRPEYKGARISGRGTTAKK